ncbi:MAG: hypothetical protein QW481_07160 [Candidatus Methanomethylicia archaeon]
MDVDIAYMIEIENGKHDVVWNIVFDDKDNFIEVASGGVLSNVEKYDVDSMGNIDDVVNCLVRINMIKDKLNKIAKNIWNEVEKMNVKDIDAEFVKVRFTDNGFIVYNESEVKRKFVDAILKFRNEIENVRVKII